MGVPEESSKVATSAIQGLSGNPLCLAVVVLAALLGVFAYLRTKHEQDIDQSRFSQILDLCKAGALDAPTGSAGR